MEGRHKRTRFVLSIITTFTYTSDPGNFFSIVLYVPCNHIPVLVSPTSRQIPQNWCLFEKALT